MKKEIIINNEKFKLFLEKEKIQKELNNSEKKSITIIKIKLQFLLAR